MCMWCTVTRNLQRPDLTWSEKYPLADERERDLLQSEALPGLEAPPLTFVHSVTAVAFETTREQRIMYSPENEAQIEKMIHAYNSGTSSMARMNVHVHITLKPNRSPIPLPSVRSGMPDGESASSFAQSSYSLPHPHRNRPERTNSSARTASHPYLSPPPPSTTSTSQRHAPSTSSTSTSSSSKHDEHPPPLVMDNTAPGAVTSVILTTSAENATIIYPKGVSRDNYVFRMDQPENLWKAFNPALCAPEELPRLLVLKNCVCSEPTTDRRMPDEDDVLYNLRRGTFDIGAIDYRGHFDYSYSAWHIRPIRIPHPPPHRSPPSIRLEPNPHHRPVSSRLQTPPPSRGSLGRGSSRPPSPGRLERRFGSPLEVVDTPQYRDLPKQSSNTRQLDVPKRPDTLGRRASEQSVPLRPKYSDPRPEGSRADSPNRMASDAERQEREKLASLSIIPWADTPSSSSSAISHHRRPSSSASTPVAGPTNHKLLFNFAPQFAFPPPRGERERRPSASAEAGPSSSSTASPKGRASSLLHRKYGSDELDKSNAFVQMEEQQQQQLQQPSLPGQQTSSASSSRTLPRLRPVMPPRSASSQSQAGLGQGPLSPLSTTTRATSPPASAPHPLSKVSGSSPRRGTSRGSEDDLHGVRKTASTSPPITDTTREESLISRVGNESSMSSPGSAGRRTGSNGSFCGPYERERDHDLEQEHDAMSMEIDKSSVSSQQSRNRRSLSAFRNGERDVRDEDDQIEEEEDDHMTGGRRLSPGIAVKRETSNSPER